MKYKNNYNILKNVYIYSSFTIQKTFHSVIFINLMPITELQGEQKKNPIRKKKNILKVIISIFIVCLAITAEEVKRITHTCFLVSLTF